MNSYTIYLKAASSGLPFRTVTTTGLDYESALHAIRNGLAGFEFGGSIFVTENVLCIVKD